MTKAMLQNQLKHLRTIGEEIDLGACQKVSHPKIHPFNPTTLLLTKGQKLGV